MSKRIYRNQNNKMFLGVLSGISQYLKVDPTIVRLFFLLICVVNPSFIILYILMALIMPDEPQENRNVTKEDLKQRANELVEETEESVNQIMGENEHKTTKIEDTEGRNVNFLGIALIIIGGLLIGNSFLPLGIFFTTKHFLAVLFILAGAYVLIRR